MKRIIYTLVLACITLLTMSQTSSENYIHTRSFTKSDASSYIDIIQYFDGLGRPIQTVQRGITATQKDLVTLTEYDDAGPQWKQWLPKSNNGNGAFVAADDFKAISQPEYGTDTRPYSEAIIEASPLNRMLGNKGPGATWENKPTSISYESNDGSVSYFYVNANGNLQRGNNYESNTLFKTISKDEDGNSMEEYKDKLGQVILKRSEVDGQNVDTYYVYNDLGQLAFVIPPGGVDIMTWKKEYTDGDFRLQRFGYIYRYDERGNCIYKRLPGCEPVYMVYDKADRLVLSQDGNQRAKITKQWTTIKYDILGRVLYTGVINREIRLSERDTIHNNLIIESRGTANQLYNTGYTCNTFVGEVEPLTVNYYDNYNFLASDSPLRYAEKEGYSTAYAPLAGDWTNGATGLLTGTRIYLLDGSNSYATTVCFYDDKGLVVQSRTENHTGGRDFVYNLLDFTGKTLQTLTEHNIAGLPAITEHYTYTYDNAQRLKDTYYTLNSNDEFLLSSNIYDELGRLTQKWRHKNTDIESFTYNIRNQTTKITSGAFEQNLFYNTNLPAETTPCYNGNIAYSTWTYGDINKGYSYQYDELNRLTHANFRQRTSTQPDGAFDEKFGYDKMGNITYLLRKKDNVAIDELGFSYIGNQVKAVTDSKGSQNQYAVKEYQDYASMTVEYLYDDNGNVITSKDQNIVTIQYNLLNLPALIQFRNGDRIINTYDATGQKLRADYYTLIQGLAAPLTAGEVYNQPYNPSTMTYEGTYYAGNKEYTIFKTPVTTNGATTYKDVYYWEKIYNPEGYADYSNNISVIRYNYYRRDHLGSTREVWRGTYKNDHGTDVAPATVQRMQYYPSGLPWAESVSPDINNRKYNGKEWIEMHGYDTYDYGARGMFPAIGGRFMTVDPLAEMSYGISPYVYCLNNPVNMVDPDGKYAVYHHYNFTYEKMIKLGYSKTTSRLVSHYASTYADNPGRAIAAAQGHPYKKGIDYEGTSASQNTASIASSSWHSMTADGEDVTNSYAKIRGQQFGWGKIITAGEEAKKAGGLDKLTMNSIGMKALGQGIHALQDAQGHGGVNMEDHSLAKDVSAPRSEIALSVTESALIITEVLSGNNSHLTKGLTLDVSGISQKQFNTIQGTINDALKSKDNVNVKFVFGN